MKNINKKVNLINRNYPYSLVTSGLVVSGLFQMAFPLLAQTGGTNSVIIPMIPGGTSIVNTAEGIYEDPEDSTKPLTTYSNTITIQVAEVSGITILPKGVTTLNNETPSEIKQGDQLCARFDIVNVGNDPSKFFIPNGSKVSSNATFEKVQYQDPTSTTPSNWIDVPANGLITNSINPGDVIATRVCIKLKYNAIGRVTVQFGEPNGRTPSQNIDRIPDSNDVYTIDNDDNSVPKEAKGSPLNGVKEASATVELDLSKIFQSLALVQQTSGGYNDNNSSNITDHTIDYRINLSILDRDPAGLAIPTDLTGIRINLNGNPSNAILVTSAIPLGTKFDSIRNVPNGWTPVYTTDLANSDTSRADQANWTTTMPTNPTAITRVGFVVVDGRIPLGSTINGMEFRVRMTPEVREGVESITQVFGTIPSNPTNANDKTPNLNKLVFDESGDNNPNNYNDKNQPSPYGSDDQPIVKPGVVDSNAPPNSPRNPNNIGKDPGNNTGKDLTTNGGGESNSISVPSKTQGVLNGPKDRPNAVGSDNNNDFINKTTTIPGSVKKGELFDPDPVTFINSIQNTSSGTQNIGITLKNIGSGESSSGTPITLKDPQTGELPNGTKVTLKDPTNANDPGISFTMERGVWKPTDPNKPALILNNIEANSRRDYTVTVDLPSGTKAIAAYPVYVIAFVDGNKDGKLGVAEARNEIINRLYTGSIEISKLSQIQEVVNGELKPISGPNGILDEKSKTATAGQVIHYVIRYKNISEQPPANTGSVGLTVRNLVIIEDGLKSPNNWGSITTHLPNSANPEATTTFAGGTNNNNADPSVTKYENRVTVLAPQAAGEFRFSRQVKQ